MISAKEAFKITQDSYVKKNQEFLEFIDEKIKREAKKGNTSTYISIYDSEKNDILPILESSGYAVSYVGNDSYMVSW
jgi:hypothetical protein